MSRNGLDSTRSFLISDKRVEGGRSLKTARKNDLYLLVFFVLAGLISFAFLSVGRKPGRTVRVTVDGQVYGMYPLDEDRSVKISPVEKTAIMEDDRKEDQETGTFSNLLVIKDGQADMTQADCPDQICVKHKPIAFKGETIVCLPHKLVVEITGEDGDDSFDVVVQ